MRDGYEHHQYLTLPFDKFAGELAEHLLVLPARLPIRGRMHASDAGTR